MKWSREERKQKLIEMSDRSPELNEAAGSEIFQMEFVDYTEDDEYIVKYYIAILSIICREECSAIISTRLPERFPGFPWTANRWVRWISM